MAELGDWLARNISTDVGPEGDGWLKVRQSMEQGQHLEQALTGKALPESLVSKIVFETWKCVSQKDEELYRRCLKGTQEITLTKALRQLLNSSNYSIDVVTTNYDRVIEYACGLASIMVTAGFDPGYVQFQSPGSAIAFSRGGRPARAVKLWKVHGSLDWFQRADGELVGGHLEPSELEGMTPLIVSPGVSKFERTYQEPFRTAIQGADSVLENAAGYLCIGFGFRDSHIEPKIVARCRRENVPTIVIARTLTDEAKLFLRSKAGNNYLGLEKFESSTRAFTSDFPDGIDLGVPDMWSLEGFLGLVG
jgi:hypothetical protein